MDMSKWGPHERSEVARSVRQFLATPGGAYLATAIRDEIDAIHDVYERIDPHEEDALKVLEKLQFRIRVVRYVDKMFVEMRNFESGGG